MDPERRVGVPAALEDSVERLLADVRELYGDAPRRQPLAYSCPHDPDGYPRAGDE